MQIIQEFIILIYINFAAYLNPFMKLMEIIFNN
jgi:hypothetical protein